MAHQDDVIWLALAPAFLDRIHSKLPVLNDLDSVSVVLKKLHCDFLVHHIVFGEEDVVLDGRSIYDLMRRDRLESGD